MGNHKWLAPVSVVFDNGKFVVRLATSGKEVVSFTVWRGKETENLWEKLMGMTTGDELYAFMYDEGGSVSFVPYDRAKHGVTFVIESDDTRPLGFG